MDAGVPIKTPIAGISVGLVVGDDGKYVPLTDIQGMEDHDGDMDFKVAGSRDGITAIQLDIKVQSIGFDVIGDALQQAKEARLFLLDQIADTIGHARADVSRYAPRMERITIPVEKIGTLIGPGGKMIRSIIEETKATVDVADDGTVTIGSSDPEASNRAIEMIRNLTKEIQIGDVYTGKVVKIAGFGAFVELTPGKDGMVHISELADYHVPSVEDVVSLGEEITVLVTDVDPMGRVKLSRRALLERTSTSPNASDRDKSSSMREEPTGDRTGSRPNGPRQGEQRGGSRSGPRPYNRRPAR